MVCSLHCRLYVICTSSWLILFFFKQTTAYELRISYWSSDLCSSDLRGSLHLRGSGHAYRPHPCGHVPALEKARRAAQIAYSAVRARTDEGAVYRQAQQGIAGLEIHITERSIMGLTGDRKSTRLNSSH